MVQIQLTRTSSSANNWRYGAQRIRTQEFLDIYNQVIDERKIISPIKK